MAKKKRLLIIHEYSSLGYGFDFVRYVICADIERVKQGYETFDFVFIQDFQSTDAATVEQLKHLFNNIVLEVLRLLPQSRNFFVFSTRNEFRLFLQQQDQSDIFPDNYFELIQSDKPVQWLTTVLSWNRFPEIEVFQNDKLKGLIPPVRQVEVVRRWLKQNVYPIIPITITLKENVPKEYLDSNLDAWQKLVNYYQGQNYIFIVLRDFSQLYSPPPIHGENVIYFNEPVISVSLRSALYQECSLNLFVANGCAAIAAYNKKTNFIMFAPTCAWLEIDLFNVDSDRIDQHKEYVCEGDDFVILKQHTKKMISRLKKNKKIIPDFYKNIDNGIKLSAPNVTEVIGLHFDEKYMDLYNPVYLKKCINNILSMPNMKFKEVLIYGAGYHSDALFIFTDIKKVNIKGFVDKDAEKQKIGYRGFHVYPPSQLTRLKYDFILISSNSFQDEIFRELCLITKSESNIIKLYSRDH